MRLNFFHILQYFKIRSNYSATLDFWCWEVDPFEVAFFCVVGADDLNKNMLSVRIAYDQQKLNHMNGRQTHDPKAMTVWVKILELVLVGVGVGVVDFINVIIFLLVSPQSCSLHLGCIESAIFWELKPVPNLKLSGLWHVTVHIAKTHSSRALVAFFQSILRRSGFSTYGASPLSPGIAEQAETIGSCVVFLKLRSLMAYKSML